MQRCEWCCFLLSLLLFSLLFSLCIHSLEDALLFSSAVISIKRAYPLESEHMSEHPKKAVDLQQDSVIWHSELIKNHTKQIYGEMELFRDEWSEFDRILYVQRNYYLFNSPELEKKRLEVVQWLNSNSNQLERNVVFQDMKETGLGNSLLAVASSYIVSRILNASFHVNWSMYHEAFDAPLVNFKTDITYATTDSSYSKWKIRWSGCNPSIKSLETKPIDQLVPAPNLVVTAYYDYSKHLLKSRQYDSTLALAGLVSRPSGKVSKQIYYTEFALMSAVQLFFQPKPFLRSHIESFFDRWKSFHLIGLQIRMGSGGADFQDSHRFLHFSAVSTFISLAEEYRQRRGYKDTEVKWFLSTDSSKVERNLTKLFPDRVIGMETFRRGHSSQEKSNRNGFYRAVLDVAVLSRCEFMVLTNHSSFGMIARMLTTRPSFAIVPARNY